MSGRGRLARAAERQVPRPAKHRRRDGSAADRAARPQGAPRNAPRPADDRHAAPDADPRLSAVERRLRAVLDVEHENGARAQRFRPGPRSRPTPRSSATTSIAGRRILRRTRRGEDPSTASPSPKRFAKAAEHIPLDYEVGQRRCGPVGPVDGPRQRRAMAGSTSLSTEPTRAVRKNEGHRRADRLRADLRSAVAGQPRRLHWLEGCLNAVNQQSLEHQLRERGEIARQSPCRSLRGADRDRGANRPSASAHPRSGDARPADPDSDDDHRSRLPGDRPDGRRTRAGHARNADRLARPAHAASAGQVR